jgi:hypothetical protein
MPNFMKGKEFSKTTSSLWNEYLARAAAANSAGQIESDGGTLLYPTLLLCTETPKHFISELVGAHTGFAGLSVKRQLSASAERYFNQFSVGKSKPVIVMNSWGWRFINLTVSQNTALSDVNSRFPFVHLYHHAVISGKDGYGAPIAFASTFESAMLDNCMIINSHESIFRVKHILNATVVKKAMSARRYAEWLQYVFSDLRVYGVHTCGSDEHADQVKAGQLANLYLMREARETTLGEFLRDHPDVLTRALGALRFEYEPYLKWVAPGDAQQAINPDLLIQRADGNWDVYDLKTAALDSRNITKGKRQRRRFIDYVHEGVAQLAHYRDYFAHAENQRYVFEKYGIWVESPNPVLVVGTLDNASPKEVAEASRMLNGIALIDYDTLMQMFLSSAVVGNEIGRIVDAPTSKISIKTNPVA